MFRIKFFLIAVFWFCWINIVSGGNKAAVGYIYPEFYGARGDGVSDDSPAFNKCLESGKIIRLKKGKTYTFHTRIAEISKESMIIQGNNAVIVIAADYPLNRADQIFRFSSRVIAPKQIQVNDLSINCLLGQKFQDRQSTGDTYIFATYKCNAVKMKNVMFRCTTEYNNVTFLESEGGDVSLDNCDVVLNTRSRQGGIFWMMNRYKDNVNISLSNCRFEYDTQDEAMCFSAHGKVDYPRFAMNVNVSNCSFYSNGNTPSSGFIISYNHAEGVFMDANIQYTGCTFKTDGLYKRKIQSYQCGNKEFDYGSFKTRFRKCYFIFNLKRKDETGILGLLPASSSISRNRILYDFKNCCFNIRNTTTLIGDKDGGKKGVYRFTNCSFDSDGSLFIKHYNQGSGQIDVVLDKCNGKQNSQTLCTENLYVTNSRFESSTQKYLYPQGLNQYGKTSLSLVNTNIGNNKYKNNHKNGKYTICVEPQKGYKRISLITGDVVYGNVNDGRDFTIYYYEPNKQLQVYYIVNGKKFQAGYIDKESCYFANVRFLKDVYRYGKNTVQVEINGKIAADMYFTIRKND